MSAPVSVVTSARVDCFHCGEPVPPGLDLTVPINGRQEPVCCVGCEAAASWIAGSGLTDYYRLRRTTADTPEPEIMALEVWDRPALQRQYVHAADLRHHEVNLITDGIHCAACTWLIEQAMARVPGLHRVEANPVSRRVWLSWDPDKVRLSALLQRLHHLGFRSRPLDAEAAEDQWQAERRAALKRLGVAGLGMMQAMMYAVALWVGAFDEMETATRDFFRWVAFFVTTPVLVYSAFPFYKGMVRELRAGRLGMDTPVSLALVLAYVGSLVETIRGGPEVYFESVAMFVFFLAIGRFVEMSVRHRSLQSGEALAHRAPAVALKRVGGDATETVAVTELEPGDRVRVLPGEALPADGVLVGVDAWVDESLLTGESRPIHKRPGEEVLAGSLCRDRALELEITALGQSTVLAALGRMMDKAARQRPRLARQAERMAAWFVARVLIFTAGAALVWLFLDPTRVFPITLAVLVVCCPCALSLAVPTALAAAQRRLARMGMLVVSGDALEALSRVDTVVFDKTGTLTDAGMSVVSVELLAPDHTADQNRALAIAAALETESTHPLARAFAPGARADVSAGELETVAGGGVMGCFEGEYWRLGKLEFVTEGCPAPGRDDRIYLGCGGRLVAAFEIRADLKPDAAETVRELKSLGLEVILLSGDSQAAVARCAATLGIEDHAARMWPQEKLKRVQALQVDGHRVVMVGDGVNDAPVLAGADVALALASGSGLAQSSADVIVATDRLIGVPEIIRSARRTRRVIRQNFGWALSYNLSAVPFAAMGFITPWMAALGMSLSSLAVTLNATRLTRAQSGPERVVESPGSRGKETVRP